MYVVIQCIDVNSNFFFFQNKIWILVQNKKTNYINLTVIYIRLSLPSPLSPPLSSILSSAPLLPSLVHSTLLEVRVLYNWSHQSERLQCLLQIYITHSIRKTRNVFCKPTPPIFQIGNASTVGKYKSLRIEVLIWGEGHKDRQGCREGEIPSQWMGEGVAYTFGSSHWVHSWSVRRDRACLVSLSENLFC